MGIVSLPSYKAGLGSGDSAQAVIGTGLSVPPGVETVLSYNGLYLNIRDWLDTYLITSIDGLNDADVRDSRELNPTAHGETAFNSYYGGRTIVITGRIRAFTLFKLRDLQSALRQAFNDLTESELIFTNPINPALSISIFCRKSQPIAMSETQSNYKFERDFQITLRASNPRFLSLISKSQSAFPVNPLAGAVCFNAGTFDAQPVYTLKGPLTQAKVRNDTTGVELQFASPITSSETITIDVAKRLVYDANGVNVFNRLEVLLTQWPELIPGSNQILFTGNPGGAAATGTVVWRDTYW